MCRRVLIALVACCLAVVALSPAPASCGLWMSGIMSLLSPSSSYEKLAEYLYGATSSQELADNTQAARAWLNDDKLTKDAGARLLDMAKGFAMLDDSTPERLCGRNQLRNLRLVAEYMAHSGMARPKAIPEPVRRLNHVVVALVVRARAQCTPLLEAKWAAHQQPWTPVFASSPDALAHLAQLDSLPQLFTFDGYLGRQIAGSIHEPQQELALANTLMDILAADQKRDNSAPPLARDEKTLTQALERYVEAPCREFMAMDEVRQVLEPYVDLLLASFIVSPEVGNMQKFYQLPGEKPDWAPLEQANSQVRELAQRLRACHVLVRKRGAAQLASLMNNAWREELESQD